MPYNEKGGHEVLAWSLSPLNHFKPLRNVESSIFDPVLRFVDVGTAAISPHDHALAPKASQPRFSNMHMPCVDTRLFNEAILLVQNYFTRCIVSLSPVVVNFAGIALNVFAFVLATVQLAFDRKNMSRFALRAKRTALSE